MFKWVGAIIGFIFRGYLGAVIGFVLGSILDSFFQNNSEQGPRRILRNFSNQSVSPGDFELNLLSLASIVIKADGKVKQSELDYVRLYFVQSYGKERANAIFRIFNEVIKKREISAQRICQFIRPRLSYEVRLQVLHFLFSIANSDGNVSNDEQQVLFKIARYLEIFRKDFESIQAMFIKSADDAYKILEINKNATNDEVKKAYRKMAKKYHPDKLQHMDEAYQKGAQNKFTKVKEAYEQIQNERGM